MSRRIEIPPRDTSAPIRVPRQRESTSKPKKPSGVLNERHTSAQDGLYREWIAEAVPLAFTFDDGTQMNGVLQSYDTYALKVVDPDGVPMLLFKQSLRSIRPA
jgi:sRNA-binding regulator protein Hfq